MMLNTVAFEQALSDIEDSDLDDNMKELLINSLTSSYSLHSLFVDHGLIEYAEEDEELDFESIEQAVDAICGEITAATLTLSSEHFPESEKLMDAISESLKPAHKKGVVPGNVIRGFSRMAQRVAAARELDN